MKSIYFNQDNHHFYLHPAEDMTEAGVRRLVQYYAKAGTIKGILFCTNVQRALYDSSVWERFRDIPRTGVPSEDILADHLQLLSERGIDQFAIWLDEAKKNGIEGWLTMRMNDCHGLEEWVKNDTGCWVRLWASEMWKNHPEYRRAPYRSERSWEQAYDFAFSEIRDHHLALVRELFERYDMFGLELDWLRWGRFFAPGAERESIELMTGFVKEVRSLADAAEKKYGHPIRLAHRISSEPAANFDSGFDIPAWARAGMADQITLTGATFDPPLREWRAMLPKTTKINVHVEPEAGAIPGYGVINYDFLFGYAAAAWSSGADGLYLFNECYRELDARDVLEYVLAHIDEQSHLAGTVRRTAVTYPHVYVSGTSRGNVLPIPLRQSKPGWDFGRMDQNITVRLAAGKLEQGARVFLRLGFSSAVDMKQIEHLEVRVNTHIVPEAEWPSYRGVFFDGLNRYLHLPADLPENAAGVLVRAVPAEFLHEAFNAIEFVPPAIDGELVWAELLVL